MAATSKVCTNSNVWNKQRKMWTNGCVEAMVRHRPRCRDVLRLLHLWPNEPKSVHLDISNRRSNRRLSCEKLLASGPENVTDGTDLWGYGLVKSTSCSHTSQSHSCFGSWGPCSYTIWSFFWRGKSVLTLWSQCQSDSVRKMLQHWHCNVQL